jgi:hypothetical protein
MVPYFLMCLRSTVRHKPHMDARLDRETAKCLDVEKKIFIYIK